MRLVIFVLTWMDDEGHEISIIYVLYNIDR